MMNDPVDGNRARTRTIELYQEQRQRRKALLAIDDENAPLH